MICIVLSQAWSTDSPVLRFSLMRVYVMLLFTKSVNNTHRYAISAFDALRIWFKTPRTSHVRKHSNICVCFGCIVFVLTHFLSNYKWTMLRLCWIRLNLTLLSFRQIKNEFNQQTIWQFVERRLFHSRCDHRHILYNYIYIYSSYTAEYNLKVVFMPPFWVVFSNSLLQWEKMRMNVWC